MKTLIRNATIVNNGRQFIGNIVIKGSSSNLSKHSRKQYKKDAVKLFHKTYNAREKVSNIFIQLALLDCIPFLIRKIIKCCRRRIVANVYG